MSRVCKLSGKRSSTGNNRSHANNATKRRFLPNLIKKKVYNTSTGKMKRMKISVSALKTLDKKLSR